ncbi:macrophage mannose receptor 1-like isoform X2 [Melanotaenia boesemani]|uniref:macrophage mannose receptor 1-like isoform X2 n=1 Tax=Melanotaenia boesemani TaxID=1250792 RepID=UPI001C040A99|nr:macrophage mannose receptor 1-like isoform X2 [Melanotaenia boesemani]
MEKVLLFICTASALCVVSSLPARQYHFVYDPKNWTEAQSYCRDMFTDLATIDNMEDVETLNNMADLDSYKYRAWIGLYNNVSSWSWSMSDSGFYKDNETQLRNWAYNQPDNFQGRECCVVMVANGEWSDVPCSLPFPSVCADVKGQEVTFTYVTEEMTFPEAQSYCRANHTDLACIRNMAENQKIHKLIPAGQSTWIGLFRDCWKWVDGSNSSFTYWNTDEPGGADQYCAAAYFAASGKWADWTCEWKRASICYSGGESETEEKLVSGSG